jgi:hypothetical protein
MTVFLRRNQGVITVSALQRLGYTEREVRGFVRHGDLRRVHRGVYADGRVQLGDRGRLQAALLAVGHQAWVSSHAAAVVWGLELGVPAKIDVTVVADHTPRHRGLRVRRVARPPDPSEIRTRNGLRVSSIPRLLIETAAAGAGDRRLRPLLEISVRRQLLDVHDLAATLHRNRRHAGTVKVRNLCGRYLPRASRKSGLERAFDRWLSKHPEIPQPERNVMLGPWEIDCHWPDRQLVLELDGRPYHSLIEEIERDNRKNTWLQAHGHRFLRVTDTRFKSDKPGVHQDLTTLLALGEQRQVAA